MKTYLEKSALAEKYFPGLAPHQATNRLRRWMQRCRPLMDELYSTGYSNRQHILTPLQVATIYRHLGEP